MKLEKFTTRKLFEIPFPTTFLSGKTSFERWFGSSKFEFKFNDPACFSGLIQIFMLELEKP